MFELPVRRPVRLEKVMVIGPGICLESVPPLFFTDLVKEISGILFLIYIDFLDASFQRSSACHCLCALAKVTSTSSTSFSRVRIIWNPLSTEIVDLVWSQFLMHEANENLPSCAISHALKFLPSCLPLFSVSEYSGTLSGSRNHRFSG